MQKDGMDSFEEQPSIIVIGPQYTRVNIQVATRLKAIRVDFKPGGLHRLVGIPMSELFDRGIPADLIFGNSIKDLNGRLLNSTDLVESFNLIQNFLLSKMSINDGPVRFEFAIQKLINADGNLPIEKVADLACMSIRQFERLCQVRIGMSPKSFARIIRFSKAYRIRESHPDLSWISIAHHAGYFDQMHLIRDFKQFTGTTPSFIDQTLRDTPLRMQAKIL